MNGQQVELILGFERGDYERVGRGFYIPNEDPNTVVNDPKKRLTIRSNDGAPVFPNRITKTGLKKQAGKRVKVLYFTNGVFDGETDIGTINPEGFVVITGKEIHLNNRVYEAERILYTDGTLYDGQTTYSHKPHGEGFKWQPNGDFSGGWFVNIPRVEGGFFKEGFVSQRLSNGDVYEGQLKDGKREGYGKMTYTNGTIYEGEFVKNKKEGKGKMTYTNGTIYEGRFLKDKRHGWGQTKYTNGFSSDAYWEKNHKVGDEIISQGAHLLLTRRRKNGIITERIEDYSKMDTINSFKAWERDPILQAELLNNNDNIINNDDINKKNKKGCPIF